MAEGVMMPTTGAQVSGHRFLVRRIEHGLVLGDVRMIHDPLGRRRRALAFGLVACLLIGIGAVVMAVLRPAVDPGDARILAASSGALYVRVGDTVHPVTNLASARLIIGEAADPVTASDAHIAATHRGPPLGLVDAPGVIHGDAGGELRWWACQEQDTGLLHVAAVAESWAPPGAGETVLGASRSGGRMHWHLITAEGRRALPDPDTVAGRVVRRHLGITPDTPTLHLGPELLNTIPELPAVALPEPLPPVLQTGARSWLRHEDGLQPISALQHGMLIDAGAATHHEPRSELGGHRESAGVPLTLPATLPQWLDPTGSVLCADARGGISLREELPAGVTLAGQSAAHSFIGELPGALGVDSGHGHYLVADTGLRHHVAEVAGLGALGVEETPVVPWTVLRLLPEGSELSRISALTPIY